MKRETFFVGSIPFRSDETFLRDLFKPFGTVEEVRVVADWVKPTCEPHAYVTMQVADPEKAVTELDGRKFGRLYLRVHKNVTLAPEKTS